MFFSVREKSGTGQGILIHVLDMNPEDNRFTFR